MLPPAPTATPVPAKGRRSSERLASPAPTATPVPAKGRRSSERLASPAPTATPVPAKGRRSSERLASPAPTATPAPPDGRGTAALRDPHDAGPGPGGARVDELSDMTTQPHPSERQKRQQQGAYEILLVLLREPQAPGELSRPSAGHGDEETSDGVSADTALDALVKLYAERLRFFIVEVESSSPSERRFRIEIECDVAELPENQLDDLGDASTITHCAEHEGGFKDRLADAVADYFAKKVGDPVFTAVAERWVTQDSFPQTAVAEACHRISDGLNTLVERPLEAVGTEIRLPGLEAATAAGIGTDLILEPVTQPLGQAAEVCEIVGLVVGIMTGFHPLALASGKMLAHDVFHRVVTRGITEAARELLSGEPDQQSPREQPEPARFPDELTRVPEPTLSVDEVAETSRESGLSRPREPKPRIEIVIPRAPPYGPGIGGRSLG